MRGWIDSPELDPSDHRASALRGLASNAFLASNSDEINLNRCFAKDCPATPTGYRCVTLWSRPTQPLEQGDRDLGHPTQQHKGDQNGDRPKREEQRGQPMPIPSKPSAKESRKRDQNQQGREKKQNTECQNLHPSGPSPIVEQGPHGTELIEKPSKDQ